jgi:hypothetical protein
MFCGMFVHTALSCAGSIPVQYTHLCARTYLFVLDPGVSMCPHIYLYPLKRQLKCPQNTNFFFILFSDGFGVVGGIPKATPTFFFNPIKITLNVGSRDETLKRR